MADILALTLLKTHLQSMSTLDNIYVIYDNFDYLERTRHQLIGDTGVFHSHTTGKLVRGSCIPPGGLLQSMLHDRVQLRIEDIAEAPGNTHDSVQNRISTFVIADALRSTYPAAVNGIFESNTELEYPRMPEIDILPSAKTTHVNLGPIMESEASINGNYRVLETIFLEQLQLNRDNDFQDRLYLAYGDQKTAKLIRACKRERTEAALSYDSHRWVLPVPGLWHLRLNFLYTIMRTFFGGEQYAQQYSTLYTHINHLGRRNIPVERPPFHHLEELVLHSFDARIVALFLTHIRDRLDIHEEGAVERYIGSLTPEQFLQHIEDIRAAGFSSEVGREANKLVHPQPSACGGSRIIDQLLAVPSSATTSQPARIVDVEFFNHIRYLQVVETYKVLKYAIKHADIGLLKRAIARLCLYFAGSRSNNYASEMMYFWRLIATEACDPVLQRAVLANGLINNRGEPNSFFEADRLNELLNLQLKELLRSRGNSTFGVDSLFRWSVLTTSYTGPLRTEFENAFGERTISDHTIKSPAVDIQSLADMIAKDSIVRQRVRDVGFEAPAILQLGLERLLQGGIADFNMRMSYISGLLYDPYEDGFDEATDDMPEDFQMLGLMVRFCLY